MEGLLMSSEIATAISAQKILSEIHQAISTVYRGDSENIDLMLTALLASGHILLEDIPGVGKTTLARSMAQVCGSSFKRIQGTPDLLPSDITGVSIYDESSKSFHLHKGPIFCDILLADEINRTPPRTQSALLEAMSEGQITLDGKTEKLSETFFCIATQNPHENSGIYVLPDSQRDRFIMSIKLGYPDAESELKLLENNGVGEELKNLKAVVDSEQLIELRRSCQKVKLEDSVRAYLFEIITTTRKHKYLQSGASPRAALSFQSCCQAYALLKNRNYVIPDDIQLLAQPALAHRLVSRGKNEPGSILESMLQEIEVPR
jgi:MoxR-like ATPase